MAKTTIEWTEDTWNPVTGCTKVSTGCKNCYAERMAGRLRAMGLKKYEQGFDVALHPHTLNDPLKIRRGRHIFVCSMSDLFHKEVPSAFLGHVFDTMRRATQHTFQVLTKRPDRAAQECEMLPWPNNIWLGTSIENMDAAHRLDDLYYTAAKTKFLSAEPLLGPLDALDLSGLDWVIVGGESGPRARPMQKDWVRSLRDRCIEEKIPFFFKQWGGTAKKKAGRILDGRTWDERPA